MTAARLHRLVLEEALTGADTRGAGPDEVLNIGGEVSGPVPDGGIVVTVRPVTEAVKVVENGLVMGSLDRDRLLEAVLPLAIHRSTLRAILAQVDHDPIDLPAEVAARGGQVVAAH